MRSSLTIRRISEEVQGVVALIAIAAIAAFVPRERFELALIVFGVAFGALLLLFPKLIRRVVPPHVRARLPLGVYDGPSTPGAPHTYGDLVRMWRDPEWRCAHPAPERRQSPAATRRMLRFVGITFGVVVLAALASFVFRRADVAVGAAAVALLVQVVETRRIHAVVESNAHTSPTIAEVWIAGLVGAVALAAVTFVALARSLG